MNRRKGQKSTAKSIGKDRKGGRNPSPKSHFVRRPKSKRARRIEPDPKLEEALRHLRSGKGQRVAAQNAGIPVGRFRRFLRDYHLAKFKGRRWRFTDRRLREVVAITTTGEKEVTVAGFNKASLVMKHHAAFRSFLELPELETLKPFEGRSVTDTSGRIHFLETRPNALYRLAASGGEPYETVYKLNS